MNIDKIVEVNIQISEAMSIDGGYDTILIMGPLPKTPGGNSTPDVASYTNLQDLKDAGFTAEDPVYIAASKVFSQSPKPSTVMIAVQKLSSGSPEKVDATLDRAIGRPGWYCICPAGINENFYQGIADWTEANEKLCICETTGISASPVSDAMLRTAVIHATSEGDCVNCAYAARFLSYDPGSEQWCFKSLPTISAQTLSTMDIASLEAKNISYYTAVGNKAMVQGGKVSGGEWIDTIRFRDWLKTEIQSKVLNLFLGLLRYRSQIKELRWCRTLSLMHWKRAFAPAASCRRRLLKMAKQHSPILSPSPVRPIWMQLPARAANLPV